MPGEDPWEAQQSCGANTPLRSAAAGGSGTSGQQARREAAQVGPGWPPPPTEAAPPRLGLPGRAAERLFPSGPAPATGSGSVRPRSDGRSGGDMESGGSFGAPLRCRLLFLAACWAVAATAAGEKVLPPPSNLSYSFIQICTLNWTWNPPENISSSCDLEYSSDILIDEVSQHKNEWRKSLFRVTDTVLNKEMRFKVRSECKNSNATNHSQWVETSVPPKGVPGTAAVGLSCVWHNLEYMFCMWHPGENASSDTNYTLFYWFDGLERHKECENYSVSQGSFECAFNFTFPQAANRYPPISILIRGDSENVMPVCATENPTTLVKPATPTIVKLLYINNGIHLQWSESGTIPANCLSYEVRYHNGDSTTAQTIQVKFNSTSIPSVDRNSKYTFQVRAQPKVECYSSKFYSEWSEEKSIGENPNSAFNFLLIVTIPLIVTVSTIILLVYLKRLKILILPPIPDPREILKRMFGEQNEDPQSCAKEDCMNGYDGLIKEEEIHSLILIETPESSNSEKEHR
ncbi:interleukin-13 receptor subunit alpha-1 [Gallus gallus]|uniref:interleukin-13 receptor subunit alpha-1 n=1 Tax=Gallus gallus TaxID=9031 RepID=UPI001AE87043|nr:interleukin-13 receptor subunit alpha-1 [Gallus gallus]